MRDVKFVRNQLDTDHQSSKVLRQPPLSPNPDSHRELQLSEPQVESQAVAMKEPEYARHPPRRNNRKDFLGPQEKILFSTNRESFEVPHLPPVSSKLSMSRIPIQFDNKLSSIVMSSPSFQSSSIIQAFPSPSQLPTRPRQARWSNLNEQWVQQMKVLTGQKLTLLELIENHSKSFPLQVKVTQGFSSPQVEIAAGDVYNIHFLKKSKVVIIRDSIQNEYTIPLNSAAQFGIVYGQGGYGNTPAIFTTAEDIMAADLLPRVVCAMRSYRGAKPKSSVDAGEVLIVQGIYKPQSSKSLLVYSTTTARKKTLEKECAGCFTTDPQQTKMYLPSANTLVNCLLSLSLLMLIIAFS